MTPGRTSWRRAWTGPRSAGRLTGAGGPSTTTPRPASLELVAEHLLAPLRIEPGTFGADERDAGRHRFDARSAAYVPLGTAPPLAPFWLPAFSSHTVTLVELLHVAELAMGAALPTVLTEQTRAALEMTVVRLPAAAGGPLSELLPIGFGLGTAELRVLRTAAQVLGLAAQLVQA